MNDRLFHLVTGEDVARFRETGGSRWAPPSLESEGFVHLSFAHQLAGTLEVHFATAHEVLLVEVDAAAVADALRVEPSRGGESFPHVHRELDTHEFLRWWLLARRATGGWSLPSLGSEPDQDAPGGSSCPPGPVV